MKTFRYSLWLVLLCMCLMGHAADGAAVPLDGPSERVRISKQRADFELIFVQKQQACYERFAVSDCLRQVRRERRQVMDDLRHQDVVLNDHDRQASAAAELSKIQQNLSPERQKEQELQRHQALQDSLERLKQSNEKTVGTVKPAATAASATKIEPPVPGRNDVLSEQQRYNEKLREAQQRKTDKAESLSEKDGSKSAKPLPMPAGY